MKKIFIFVILGMILYKPTMNYLIGQVSHPKGAIGYILTKIWNKTFVNMTDWGLQNIEIQIDDHILDVGCGGGETIHRLANKTTQGKVYGIDISSEAVKSSIEKNQKWVEQNRTEIFEADVASLPFEDNTMDKITAIQTHFYWSNLEKGFSEIHRILKSNGVFLITCEKDKIEYHMDNYKKSNELKELLKSIGFSSVIVHEDGNWIKFICQK
ncbi:class I SAM-dependent methyltransferase [Lysinibacillus sp. CNPSo 3705]|uniref:class I SAM-dependent methyltransferase n=1 Tax=Lysinibacillus sp. CNPSo 3705 TaxID=3028148 RepID=UPI0023634192|nr:class I SAM-dependent methyltransferase [Lysinibacillus sp. CNPSo 3705]MDD1505615.1 class I SAM-dependent methyltransferase [Lysinibacillus sp. CNPSo 3705]